MKKLSGIVALAIIFIFIGCNSNKVELSGAGATFPLPYYNLVFKNYLETTGCNVSYGGIGSGGGIRSLKDGVVDFAGSDAFLSGQEMNEMPPVVHVPTCMGAVVLGYNLPGIKELKLTSNTLAAIFMGKITQWNDTLIQALNPKMDLPNMPITVIYRSDGSGTTFVFSDYLSKVSPEWAEHVGIGKSLSFPVGIAAKGNPGVSGNITQIEGAIGYMGSEYAFVQKISIAHIQNASGEFVYPTGNSISEAATGDIPDDTRMMITNSTADEAYPISCLTWIIVYQNQNYAKRTEKQSQATIALLRFMLSDEIQQLAGKVHYAPLSPALKNKAEEIISSIQYK